jgi:glycosyltransferase involved in cell wall biosynthesis
MTTLPAAHPGGGEAMSAEPASPRPFTVLQSFPEPRETTNPYVVMLRDALDRTPGARVLTFSWRRALTARYDAFHAHWPEILVDGNGPLKKLARQGLFVLFLLRLRLTRVPLVRTVHNLELPEGLTRREVVLLRWAERLTALRIRINETTEPAGGTPVETVLHGHYRGWYAPHPRRERRAGRLAFVGQVRRYKGVESLVAAFQETTDAGLSLHIAGRPTSEGLAEQLRQAAADPRIDLSLTFLSDAELVAEVTEAELVVLPYREMHNSGGALAALSLGTPVLVPDNEVTRRLAAEVGPGWVHAFTPPLTGADLEDTLAGLRADPPAAPPDLSRREWEGAGRAHLAAYRRARAALRD